MNTKFIKARLILFCCTISLFITACASNTESDSNKDDGSQNLIANNSDNNLSIDKTENNSSVISDTSENTSPDAMPEVHYDIGDEIIFGNYGKEDIEWIVLANDDKKALLWSKYCIDVQKYNNATFQNVSWKTCHLRQWLNEEFMYEAFGEEEQKHIINSRLKNIDCEKTNDNVFILSAKELQDYVTLKEWLTTSPTHYARVNGIYTDSGTYATENKGKCCYWIRGTSEKEPSDWADYISSSGKIIYSAEVNDAKIGIRPAIWYSYEELETVRSDSSDYIFKDSSERYLTKEDLKGLSKKQLRLARNEIYARNGYIWHYNKYQCI